MRGGSGERPSLWRAAERYVEEDRSVVLLAGERNRMGSSRDWAAKGVALLGVRAVPALRFERIHRSNLIGLGILPLGVPFDRWPQRLNLHGKTGTPPSLEEAVVFGSQSRWRAPIGHCFKSRRLNPVRSLK